ncbi:MAG: M36 family metallopeptidase [Acidobacteria bacterium]|nr:M36 family metallopeptidase [Acidobacteriota bacterium]
MHRVTAFALIAALATLPLAAAGFSNTTGEARVEQARIFQPLYGEPLAISGVAGPMAAVSDFLSAGRHGQAAVDSLEVVSQLQAERTGFTHLRARQRVGDLEVFGSYVRAAFNGRGELIHVIENLVEIPAGGVIAARISPEDALEAALAVHHGSLAAQVAPLRSAGASVTFDKAGYFFSEPVVRRVAVPMTDGSLQEGFLVETWSHKDNLLYHTLVSGGGRVLGSQLRTNTDSYNVFPDHPGNSSQTVVAGPGSGNSESPSGWLSGSQTTVNISGNNVHAYLDTDDNNSPDGGGSAVTDGNFLTSANLSQDPATAQNQAVAVQNLFYLNNVIHDELYRHGFIETAGNFQNNNFGQGGAGNDAVNAEAQDGSGTNNANFSTPSDGSPGRMQMYLWTATNPRRDGDVDSDIVWHEYCHGLTWRMIGNMSGPMSGAIGEGMSDCCSLLANLDPRVGEYSTNDPDGIRSAPYDNPPRTYGDFGGSSVHFDGEIYGAACWRMITNFQGASVSLDTLKDYIVGGMNFTPAGPAMEDMRDGILQEAAGSGDECLIWQAFADTGIGVGADARVKGGGPFGGGSVTITESFALPPECSGCVPTETTEMSCNDGIDNDCDGDIDSADSDCGGGGCFPLGASCTSNGQCCSNKCKGPSGGQTCK